MAGTVIRKKKEKQGQNYFGLATLDAENQIYKTACRWIDFTEEQNWTNSSCKANRHMSHNIITIGSIKYKEK